MKFVQIDAFAKHRFAGNPAAVLLLDAPGDAEWMQQVAMEMNLSETAFLVGRTGTEYDLRWFTPETEVDLCGHATLAAAHFLATEHDPDATSFSFETRSGTLRAELSADGAITLDFPIDIPDAVEAPAGLAEAIGADPVAVALGARSDYVIEVESDTVVRSLDPDQAKLGAIESPRGFIVTARNDRDGFDIVSRWFGPEVGVPEDPVTGSAHTLLAPYWAPKLGRQSMMAEQASARGGELHVEIVGDRVLLTGHAVTVARGELI